MRAVGVRQFGGPDALEVVEVDEVHAGAGEVRIRVHAATVNPTDTYQRDGSRVAMLDKDPPPYVPGMDIAGVVDEIGPGVVGDLRVGDEVMAMIIPSGVRGGYREQITVPVDSVARTPEGATLVEAATLPMNGLTARLTLDRLGLREGETLAVTGAAGCYGGYVVQLAKADGLRVIADASPADTDLVHALGADVVVPRGDDIADRIREVMPDGVDALADGAVQNQLAVPAVRDGGSFASVRRWSGADERGITFHQILVSAYDHRGDLLATMARQVEAGALTLRVAATYEPSAAPEAHRRLEAGGTRGRLVIVF